MFRVASTTGEHTVTCGEDVRWSCTCPAHGECSHMYAAARLLILEDPAEHAALEQLWQQMGS